MTSPISRFAGSSRSGVKFGRLGDDPFPFLGKARLQTPKEREEREIVKTLSSSRVFDVQDPDSMKDYHDLLDRVYSNWYEIFYTNQLFDQERRYIFVIWGVRYMANAQPHQMARMFQTAPVKSPSQTQALFNVAGQMINDLETIKEMKRRDHDEDEEDQQVTNFYTDSGVFDILDTEQMTRFHKVFDAMLMGKCLCDTMKIQYDQEMRKIFFVWVSMKQTQVATSQGWY